jgi:hypothetical protein
MGCDDDTSSEDLVTVRYKQTFCADPWSASTSIQDPAAFASAAADYVLKTYKINLRNARTEDRRATEAAVCNACTCTSGLNLYAQVTPLQAGVLSEIGFQQQ